MKRKQILYVIAISSFALAGLVVLQINWIIHAGGLQEEQLKHRITMASGSVYRQLARDEKTLDKISERASENQGKTLHIPIDSSEKARIGRILKTQFRYHQITLDYNFSVVDKTNEEYVATCSVGAGSHGICLDGLLNTQKAELRVDFMDKNLFLFSEMRWMLVSSLVLIVLITACFIFTIRTIWRQKKLSEMTTDFINNMTHELKTPISTVSLASNMLRRNQILEQRDKIIHYSGVIHEENQKLQNQVEQVLRIAKLERQDFKLERQPTNIHEVIQDAIKSIDLQVQSRHGQIRCYLNAMRHEISADVNHLTNVISNLLDNANKYSPENPQITVSTHDKEDGIIISVEDKGIGMSKDKQKYIFHKFYRVPTGNIHDVKGFGLGLAYVKMMVDAHKGHINLNSSPGEGSRFDIFLPFQ